MVAPAIIAAGISAGGSLLSSLFGGGESETKINYNAIRRDAERAGFNPLTALRNGASAGFTTTMHPPAFGAAISDAANAFASVFANMDPNKDRMEEIQFKLAEASLDNLQTDTALRLRRLSLGDAPAYSAGNSARTMGVASAASSESPMEPGQRTLTNPYPQGSGVGVNPAVPDAASAEERYGDILSNVFGVGVAVADFFHNARSFKAPTGGVRHGPDWTNMELPRFAPAAGTAAPWRPPSLPLNRGW